MSPSNLSFLREKIDKSNEAFFSHLKNRQEIINKIVYYKNENNESLWDLKRELKLFLKLKNQLSNIQACAQFSLMMEMQMPSEYPKWSQGKHLVELSGDLRDFVNPVLLFVVNKPEYLKLNLEVELKSLIENELYE